MIKTTLMMVMEAATAAGAATAFLSGAGPTVGAFVDQRRGEEHGLAVAQAMGRAFTEAGVESQVEVMSVDTRGLEVCPL